MQGRYDIRGRNVDGGQKCILQRIAADLQAATTPKARTAALKEMGCLLNDNVEVITSRPGPATPPAAA